MNEKNELVAMEAGKEEVDVKDVKIVMCIPCLEGMKIGFVPYKNSTVSKCSQCKTEVFVGPKQMELVKKEGLEIWCPVCCIKKFGQEEVSASMKILTNKKMGD
jgi:DNA-directed RNA polymerase subunit RPC12/RpoP